MNEIQSNLKTSLEKCRTRNPDQARAIVMYSGGLDSVALLANILQHTNQKVHVHHIDIANFENRTQAERDACRETVVWLRRNYRDFEYSTSSNTFNIGKGGGLDLTLSMFVAGRLTIALGNIHNIVYTGHIDPAQWEITEGAAVFNALFMDRIGKPEWLRPLARMSKQDIYNSIPAELAELTWSCRRPVYENDKYIACGTCHTCKSLKDIRG